MNAKPPLLPHAIKADGDNPGIVGCPGIIPSKCRGDQFGWKYRPVQGIGDRKALGRFYFKCLYKSGISEEMRYTSGCQSNQYRNNKDYREKFLFIAFYGRHRCCPLFCRGRETISPTK